MAPTPQERRPRTATSASDDGERVVITGMAGLFPQSRHVKDLADILYNKKNPISEETCRWSYNHPEVPGVTGNVPGLEFFDAQFFKVHFRLAECMDPMNKKTMEMAYQAIYDAGVSPNQLYGKKVGVYIGSCFSETEKASFYGAQYKTGFGIAGCSKTMFANRISYWLNAKGPSMSVDEACCSSLAALEQAHQAISRGECEAAIVGGANVCLHPQSSVHYARIIKLCRDGKTKSFATNADGCAKSEAINVLFLQKAKDAKRIYAEVIHVRNEFNSLIEGETGPRYGFYRETTRVVDFLNHFYEEAKVPPQAVEYVEAFGSAVPEVDRTELEAIEEVFCKKRQQPLLVGSVMSNIGYGEAASGISAITKVLLAYEHGKIPANLHYENARTDIAALRDGKMEIVADHKSFHRSYTAVNSFSVTGINAHVLMKGHYKPKNLSRYKSAIPHLVTISARQDTSVQNVLDDLKSRPVDPEELALLDNIHQYSISGHLGRGYTILSTNEKGETVSLAEKANYFDDAKHPLWFVYSGMGSQWSGMGAQLMRIPIFAAAIQRCHKVLEPKGLDIIHILTSEDKTIFDNILNSFVGIAAVQIGLTDVLTCLGLVPDKIIGHSVGELGCAYADGCLTTEEMILAAYSRGLVSIQTPFIRGSMAAVGLGYEQIKDMLPPEIEVACHNGPESSTISGPADIMKEFVAELVAKGVFAREVPCSNIAYHSRYIADAGPGLLKYLSEVIKEPKARSEKWLSTSVPQEKWNEPLAKLSSAEYHTNNLLSSVLFEETSRLIPANAVLVEIAPHGLLQAILKRSLPESCKHIPLTRRGHSDNVIMVLDAIGKLYMEGYNPKTQALYPKVEFPVSTGTPMLSHLVEWAHQEKWGVALYTIAQKKQAAATKTVISIHDDEHSYLRGHVIRGKNLYPFSAALVAVWDTLAMSLSLTRRQLSVEFRDVHFTAQPVMHDQRQLRLSVTLHRGSGSFEVLADNRKVVRGYIQTTEAIKSDKVPLDFESDEKLHFNFDEIYKILEEREFSYKDEFRSLYKVDHTFTQAQILWNDNWVTFIDGIFQLHFLRTFGDTTSMPVQIRKIGINIKEHAIHKAMNEDGKILITALVNDVKSVTTCGGVILEDLRLRNIPPLKESAFALNTLKFVPRALSCADINNVLQVYLQIVSENISEDNIHLLEVLNSKDKSVIPDAQTVLDNTLGLSVTHESVIKARVLESRDNFLTNVNLLIVENLSNDENLCQLLYRVLPREVFIINVEQSAEERIRPTALYTVVSSCAMGSVKIELVKWRPSQIPLATTVVSVRCRADLAQLSSTRKDISQRQRLVVISPYPPVQGLKELVKIWRSESDRNQIYLVMVSEKDRLDQLPELDLAYNVLNEGVWGGDYHTSWRGNVSIDREITLCSGKIGDLDSLQWVEKTAPVESGIPVTVHYAAINNLDVKIATGVRPFTDGGSFFESSYCMDFSGVTERGQRVMGILPTGAASTRVMARPELLWPVPAHWSLEDAVTVPSAYMQAFYAYEMKMKFRPGYTVLVHGGAGALGQAAIAIALANRCKVFTTVSDVRKKRFLMKLFPELREDYIGNSRDRSFHDMVMNATNKKGCNVVICSAQGDLKNDFLNTCGSSGVTIDTTRLPSQEDYNFGMYHLTLDRTYVNIDFKSALDKINIEELKTLQLTLSEGIGKGYVRPLSRITYPPSQVSRAFRLLAASRHRGRVVLRLRDSLTVSPRIMCSPDACQIIVCDNSDCGIHLADRLVARGARKLQIQNSNISAHLHMKKKIWENLGVKVIFSSEDLNNSKNMVSLFGESTRLGPVEGVFVMAIDSTDQAVDKTSGIILSLDWLTRKSCPSLRYFVVVSAGSIIGQQTCTSRCRDGLPATSVNLLALKTNDNFTETSNLRSGALNAIEQAIRSSQPTMLAVPRRDTQESLLQQISKLADIEISKETPEHINLQDLNIDLTRVPVICAYLCDAHNIALQEDEVLQLTIKDIKDLEGTMEHAYKSTRGLESFFSCVDPDELLATTDMVFLPSLVSSGTMRGDDFDLTKKYLCLIPGMEGHHGRFRVLCERLKIPAIVLQPGLDLLHETLRETAERYAKLLLTKIEVKNDYYLLGYESGVLLALEVAAILEDHGLSGTVYCVGGTPEDIQATLLDQISGYETEEQLKDDITKHMFTLMTGDSGMDRAFVNCSSWEEKIEVCVRTLLGKVPHSAQYARGLIRAAYARIVQMRSYKPQIRQLKSKLILLQASNTQQTLDSVTASLQRYSKQPVVAYQLQTPLASATYDLRCGAIVNRHLDEEIQRAYDESNLCENYLLNPNTFMDKV